MTPDDPDAHHRHRHARHPYRRLALRVGAVVLSIGIGVGLILLTPSAADRAAKLVAQGAALEAEGKGEMAAGAYAAALAEDKENLAARQALVPNLIRRGRLDGAEAQLKALRERAPNDPDLNLQLAELAISRFDGPGAVAALGQAQSADPARLRATAAAARYLTAADDAGRGAALAEAEAILAATPDSLPAAITVASARSHGEDPSAALPVLDAALKLHPQSIALHTIRFDVLKRSVGQEAAAAEEVRTLYRLFPDNRDVQGWVRDYTLEHGTPDEAVTLLRDLAARAGNRGEDHAVLADYVVAHYPGKAAVPVLDGLASGLADRRIADGYSVRAAEVRFDQGEQERAILILREIVKSAGEDTRRSLPLGALARTLAATGQREAALQAAEEAARLDPKNVEAQLVRATLALEADDGGHAVEVARQALAAVPDDPRLMMVLARGYEAQDMVPLALRALAQAVEVTRNGAAESRAFVTLLVKSGNRPMAASVLQAALRAHPDDADLKALAAAEGLEAP